MMKLKKTPEENLRILLVDNAKFRCVVYDELDHNKVPSAKNLRAMVLIFCYQYEKNIYDNKGYPSTKDQWILAKQIIRAFPQLKITRVNENAPDESAFFWWHSGNSSGEHGGYIYHRVRNIVKTLPKGMKKYSRPDITKSEGARNCFPTSLLKQAADLAAQTASSKNIC